MIRGLFKRRFSFVDCLFFGAAAGIYQTVGFWWWLGFVVIAGFASVLLEMKFGRQP